MPDERDEDEDQRPAPPRRSSEGVRIIGAEEAAALDARKGRLPDDSLRYGDVPPAPEGPRPSHRFPLPERERGAARPSARPARPNLPHWTEPPTGEVPRLSPAGDDDDEADIKSSSGFGRGARWRDQSADWAQPDFDDADELDDRSARVGALDSTRSDVSDPFSFDEPVAEPPPEPRTTTIRTSPRVPQETTPSGAGPGDRNVAISIATGVAIAVLAVAVFRAGPAWTLALATVVVVLAAVEVFDVFRRAGYRPATLLALVAIGALMLAAYARGERALPLMLALMVIFTMLWYLGGVVRGRPTISLGITLLGFMWVGFLGSFAALMLRYPNREGIAFLGGAIIATVANDVGALFAGRQWGSAPMAADISPNKTWEGALGGTFATFVACAILGWQSAVWDLGSGLALALVVSIVAPLGDLSESMIKRDLGVKDMGSLLPGHGGVLDRFDAILFVLPAVYYLVELLNLAS
jgi:phosphatidate cytidylyltransferase